MAELPAHPMFWSDFFADTEHMSEGAAKAYLFIIGHSWIRGGKVKNDDRLLARLCRLSLKRWKAIKDEVMEMLEVDEEGNVYQRRVQKDYVDVRRRAIVNSKNGAKGGKAKAAKKFNKNNDGDIANATNSPERNESETLASKTKTKESTGKGLERRSLRPGGQDPPPTQPDPEKFSMTAEWVMPSDLHDHLTAEHVPKLGVDPFWRQVENFRSHHAALGTVNTEAGFAKLLRGWLERADANLEGKPSPRATGHANGAEASVNGHDPPKKRGCGDQAKFLSAGLALCRRSRQETVGDKDLMGAEEQAFKIQLVKIFQGDNQVLGVKWGPNLTPDEVFAKLPEFDGQAQSTGKEQPIEPEEVR